MKTHEESYNLKQFKAYIKNNYNLHLAELKMKYNHSISVAKISKKLAKSLNLINEDITTAFNIGLLHDIGRFEQFIKFNTFFKDWKNIDHGDYGAKILEEGLINNYKIPTETIPILLLAIREHSKYLQSENLSGKYLLFTNIIRDVDIIDNLQLNANGKQFLVANNDGVSEEVISKALKGERIFRGICKSKADVILLRMVLSCNLNYKESMQMVYDNKYLLKIPYSYKERLKQVDLDKLVEISKQMQANLLQLIKLK